MSNNNRALIDFANHFYLDGDYLRCRECERPQVASCAHHAFQHRSGCELETIATAHPWKMLAGLATAAVAQAPIP